MFGGGGTKGHCGESRIQCVAPWFAMGLLAKNVRAMSGQGDWGERNIWNAVIHGNTILKAIKTPALVAYFQLDPS